ncbi:MAG TPA: septum formation initiator family protein [Candidatus Paceibacterota bacterium]|jgi:cell division protein FtsB|nr:septum formation initiator family protein [Candidatus Paceibacterota bacterium]
MRDFQQNKRWKNVVESWPVLVFLGILLFLFAWGIIGLMSRMQTTRENRKIAENKLKEFQDKKRTFEADVAKLDSQNGIEETIRERFPVVKEGEGLIVIVDDKTKAPESEAPKGGFFSFLFFWRD